MDDFVAILTNRHITARMPPVCPRFEIDKDDIRIPRHLDPSIPELQSLASADRIPIQVNDGSGQPAGAQAITHFAKDALC
jgi:hypothetical protein